MNGRSMNLAVPNVHDDKPNFEPKPEIATVVKALKAGDFIKVTYAMDKNTAMLQTVAAYPLKAGEELPNGFVFNETYEKKEGKIDYQMVDAKKFDQVDHLRDS